MSVTPETTYAPHPTPQRGHGFFMSANDNTNTCAYCIDNLVYIVGLENLFDVNVYVGHQGKTTAATYSPNGRWVASADEAGNVKIWEPKCMETGLLLETRPISGPIFDISWTGDNERISVVGQGQNNSFGCVVAAQTGSAQGEVMGHTKVVNTGCLKPTRPFRFVTAGDDFTHVFYKGPPFKFDHSCKDHEKFVLCARFAPDGSVYATTGLDGKVCIYDGKESTKINVFQFPCGVTCISFSPDSKQGLISLTDGRALVINIADGSVAEEYKIGSEIWQQQAGTLWTKKYKISFSLNGDFNYLENGQVRVERAHSAAITSACLIPGGFVTADTRGMILFRKFGQSPYASANPEGVEVKTPHVIALALSKDGEHLYAARADATITVYKVADGNQEKTLNAKVPIKGLYNFGDDFLVHNQEGLLLLHDGEFTKIATPFSPTAVAVHPEFKEICIGGPKGATVFIDPKGAVLGEAKGHDSDVVAIAYSADGTKVATAAARKDITVWARDNLKEEIHTGWSLHSLPVTKILFAKDGQHLITVSADRTIRQWSLEKKRRYVVVERAHQQRINDAYWIDETHLLTVGEDAAAKIWAVAFI
ncbi:WD repeat protein, putative [Trichomonas vaginalis G3]|uniref:WD repeat protein, putative n=1 Tax=Trichomonas vaginalis (strain ATCC PRA-98 / G3) TaxID=412133 RepID=A2F8R8_TRIV3|nr:WD repeat-containing protein 1 family [Trichomonas vaginalis G3]EAX98698.1 WD repeat protein, putative [Trichomonas vaginalis G3]KAI5492981.1 WD repeat-containing protein 1 family [Trichomonas vaginalis G3]|eukprot:XP_001311628.1 WD repeat protein [Trichomonas vaginalis G3]